MNEIFNSLSTLLPKATNEAYFATGSGTNLIIICCKHRNCAVLYVVKLKHYKNGFDNIVFFSR